MSALRLCNLICAIFVQCLLILFLVEASSETPQSFVVTLGNGACGALGDGASSVRSVSPYSIWQLEGLVGPVRLFTSTGPSARTFVISGSKINVIATEYGKST